jgi:hypothetical protein
MKWDLGLNWRVIIEYITAWPNLPDIVCLEPYRPHGFVLGDYAWPQNTLDNSATNTTNKASYQILTRRCWIVYNKRERNVGACKAHVSIGERLLNSSNTYVISTPFKSCRFHSVSPEIHNISCIILKNRTKWDKFHCT